MTSFPLPSFGRETGLVAATLGLLLLGGVAFTSTLEGALATDAAAAPGRSAAPTPAAATSRVILGDTGWGFGSDTYCEAYVEWRTGIGIQGATAFQAYQRLAALGLVHPGPPPSGALVYFGPSPDNEDDGHVGIADGAGLFTSVTFFGVQQEPLAGWAAPYLGWVRPSDIQRDRFGRPVTPTAGKEHEVARRIVPRPAG